MSKRECYAQLFGEFGASLSDADWIALANDSLPPNLSALNARIVKGSRTDRLLQVSYRPGPESFTFFSLSGGCIAEMLDQAAAHCGTFVTSCGCPTLTMTTRYLYAGTGNAFVATTRLLAATSAAAIIEAELTNDRGRLILRRPSSFSWSRTDSLHLRLD
jgi:acyl-coenzyme A thioesterase PaaI-like protein